MDDNAQPSPEIDMIPVESSQIAAIGHDPETNTLAIQFPVKERYLPAKGSLYHYDNFTAEDFAAFLAAPSKGSHFIRTIKANPTKYPYRKIA